MAFALPHPRPFFRSWLWCLVWVGVWATSAESQTAAPKLASFETDVLPILQRSCWECHGPHEPKSGLDLTHRAGALKGGNSGKILEVGNAAGSRLIQMVSGTDPELVMPKKGPRLSPIEIGILRAWIDQGLSYPSNRLVGTTATAAHWAFAAPATNSPPHPTQLSHPHWPRNPIDAFVLQKLDQNKLKPSPPADRATLIRRVTYNLHGLPPTPQAIDDFVKDPTPNAYERLVDRLLQSPRYGERWGRHWLDVVHFGETHGYDKDKPRPNAWPYRDYVIRSFNSDLPYTQFIEQQLAGDVVHPQDPQGIVATGFIASGPWDFVGHVELPESKTDGLIARYNDRDDMVMNVFSTFQSLSVHCARCHNHKFDPIKQEEYYRLQSVFAGIDRADRPYDANAQTHQARLRLSQELEDLSRREQTLVAARSAELKQKLQYQSREIARLRKAIQGPTPGAPSSPSNGYHSQVEPSANQTKWVMVDLGQVMPIDEIRLVPARPTDFADTPGFGFPLRFKVELLTTLEGSETEVILDRSVSDHPNPGNATLSVPVAGRSARWVRLTALKLWKRSEDYVLALAELQVIKSGVNQALGRPVLSLDSIEAGRWARSHLVDGYSSRESLQPTHHSRLEQQQLRLHKLEQEHEAEEIASLPPESGAELRQLRRDRMRAQEALSKLPPPLMVYAATKQFTPTGNFKPSGVPRPVHLLRRGEVTSPGPLVSPGGLAAVVAGNPDFPLSDPLDEGSRRAALARWITHPENFLTRRSIVNRVWHYHFGRGIVETPNDFGMMGSLPTHPELLDWLARWFQAEGESIKKLHRLILMSATYRQASTDHPEFSVIDQDNRYLWRMNRTRLDAESVRDSLLQLSAQLDLTMGGPSAQQFHFKDDHSPVYDYTRFDMDRPEANRRSIYRFIVRSVPDPWMDSLDCPDASLLTPKRNLTLTALQALALLNNPFVLRQSEELALKLARTHSDLTSQINQLCRLVWGRDPAAADLDILLPHAQKHGLTHTCRLMLNSNEFLFID